MTVERKTVLRVRAVAYKGGAGNSVVKGDPNPLPPWENERAKGLFRRVGL